MKTIIFDLEGTLAYVKPTIVCLADLDRLTHLRQQYNFALVSGGPKNEVFRVLAETGLLPLFDEAYIVTFEDTNSEKETGKPFKEIKKRLEGHMVMIGDSEGDEMGSKVAGIPFIKVNSYTDINRQREELASAIDKAVLLIEKAS